MNQEKQFLQAFEEYGDALFRHCYFRVSDRERALELVQEVFTKTWEYIARGGEVQQFKSFLYRAANNLIVDEYRKRKSTSLDALLEEETITEGSFEELRDGNRDEVEMKLDAIRLSELLRELPEHYRQVVSMRYIDSLTPKEIAELIGESENVVSVRIHRGLKQLQKIYAYE